MISTRDYRWISPELIALDGSIGAKRKLSARSSNQSFVEKMIVTSHAVLPPNDPPADKFYRNALYYNNVYKGDHRKPSDMNVIYAAVIYDRCTVMYYNDERMKFKRSNGSGAHAYRVFAIHTMKQYAGTRTWRIFIIGARQ